MNRIAVIPDEVMQRCIGYLQSVDVARLVATCRRFHVCWLNCGGSARCDELDREDSVPHEWKWLSVVCRGHVGPIGIPPNISCGIWPYLSEIRIDFQESCCDFLALGELVFPTKTPALCVMRLRVCFGPHHDEDHASRIGMLSDRYGSEPLRALVIWCETADDSPEARQRAADGLVHSLFSGARHVRCVWGNENDRIVGAAHLGGAILHAFSAERQASHFACRDLKMVFWRAEQVPLGLMFDLTRISSLEILCVDIHGGSVPRGWCAWSSHTAIGGCRVICDRIRRLRFRLRPTVSVAGDDFVGLWNGIIFHLPHLEVLRIDVPFDCIGDAELHRCARLTRPHRLRSVHLCPSRQSDQRVTVNPSRPPTAGAAHLFDQLTLLYTADDSAPLRYHIETE